MVIAQMDQQFPITLPIVENNTFVPSGALCLMCWPVTIIPYGRFLSIWFSVENNPTQIQPTGVVSKQWDRLIWFLCFRTNCRYPQLYFGAHFPSYSNFDLLSGGRWLYASMKFPYATPFFSSCLLARGQTLFWMSDAQRVGINCRLTEAPNNINLKHNICLSVSVRGFDLPFGFFNLNQAYKQRVI